MSAGESLAGVSTRLSEQLGDLDPGCDVTHVLDPTVYARRSHEAYCSLAKSGVDAVLLGMNPGPWGMAQTGVPFGEVDHVRSFLGIDEPVDRPANEHPKRPVLGFECPRSEVSGRRLWSWAEERFVTADAFFRTFFVWNWCPLCFMEEGGRNRTPDKLPLESRQVLEPACDAAVREVVQILKPKSIIGVGAFARKRAAKALEGVDLPIYQILHPSPASPAANRGWAPQVDRQLQEAGFDFVTA
ncbi:MAG: single-stranded DNA-binding protein [Planctomycetes bacterium]|nr:single-stranded DNA-binding protein [Planctomycetota bacterium]